MKLQTDLELQKLEALKRFPESIIRIETSVVAICARCFGRIAIKHPCLIGAYVWDVDRSVPQSVRICPHCFINGNIEYLSSQKMFERKGRAERAVLHNHIPHYEARITRYITRDEVRKIGWLRRERVLDYAEEIEVIRSYLKD